MGGLFTSTNCCWQRAVSQYGQRSPGNHLAGVHVLRDIHQAQRLLNEVEQEQQLVVIGNSFIAMELAAALRNQGY